MKKFIGNLIIVSMIMATFIVQAQAESTSLNYSFLTYVGGLAANSTPISTREELEGIKNNLSGNYHLTRNIDLSGEEWNPIGDKDNRFTGTFDGRGHIICNMKITNNNDSAGLFAYAYNATIKNVGMYGTNILVNSGYAGGVVGTTYGSRISNCFNVGTITSSSYAGGIIGYASYYMKNYAEYVTSISNCYNIGNIEGSYAGGICGYISWSNTSNCCNTGMIKGSYAGGICGYSNGNISSCWNSGSISSTSYAGGIAGKFSYRSSLGWALSTTLQNSYNKGKVSGPSYSGGIAGYAASDYSFIAKINNCYNVGDISGKASGICWADTYSKISNSYCLNLYKGSLGTQLTFKEMHNSTYFDGFDFSATWRISSNTNSGYPYLRAVPIKIDTTNSIPVSAISMMSRSATIKVGDTYQAMAYCMPTNAADKALTWSTNNPLVATVNNNGVVTAKGPGKATITAKSNNGKKASCIVTVTIQNVIDYDDFKYSFSNSPTDFGYEKYYRIPAERYLQAGFSINLSRNWSQELHNWLNLVWGGNCFGMSTSSVLFYKNVLQEEKYDSSVTKPVDFIKPCNSTNYKLRDMIELFQISQYLEEFEREQFSAEEIAKELDKGNPVTLSIYGTNNATGASGGHRVVIYGYNYNTNGTYVFEIYDCSNFVYQLVYNSNDNSSSFGYNDTSYNWHTIRGFNRFDTMNKVYNTLKAKGDNEITLFSLRQEPTYTYIFRPAENLTITNSLGQVSTISNGELLGEIDDAKLIPSSYLSEEPAYTIILPTDTYTIVGSGDEVITTSFADDYMSASVTTKSSTPITISNDLKEISVDTAADEEYDITYTTYDNIFDEMNLSGTATETVTTRINDADILISGVETLTASASVSDSVVSANSDSLSNSDEITVKCEETDSGATLQILSTDAELTEKTSLPERLTVDMPAYDLASGTYTEGQVLNFTKDDETIIYYTTDGSIPSADNGIIYSLPVEINKSMTIKAISTKYGYLDSEIVELNYTLPEVDMPQANVESGEYDTVITVELSTGNYDDTIYYTLDGSSPLENGILYTVPINISEDTYLQAYTLRNGCISEISEYEYTVAPTYPFYFSNSLTNQDGEIITSDNIADVTKVKMTLSKLHTGDHTGVFLIAFYGADNSLLYVKSKQATISEETDEVEIDITEDVSSAYKIKAFAWKDLSSIQPICEALEENIIIE